MEPSVVTAWIAAAVALAGAAGTFLKARGESRQLAVAAATDVVTMLREELSRLNTRLETERKNRAEVEQRLQRRVDELEQETVLLQHRIERLEYWIVENTDQDPEGING